MARARRAASDSRPWHARAHSMQHGNAQKGLRKRNSPMCTLRAGSKTLPAAFGPSGLASQIALPRPPSGLAVMASEDCEADVMSVGSSRSRRSSASLPSGPITVDGVTFLKIKRCPMCNLCNSDPNPITGGPRGIDKEPFVMWHKGTQQLPEGRFCRVCVQVFSIAGFAHELKNVDTFLEARKGDPNLQREWKAARDEYLAVISEHSRLRGGVKSLTADRVTAARKKVVKAFTTSQVKASSKFRAVKREKYERAFPGRIAKMSLKTQFIKCDGVRTEVVLLRQLPQDEWDVEVDDIQGVAQEPEQGKRYLIQGA